MSTFPLAAVLLAALTTVSGTTKTFIYDQGTPTIVCAANVVCDVILAPDDDILDIATPDSQKRDPNGWIIARGLSHDRPVLYVTPNRPIGATNLIVTTSARTYHMRLLASPMTDTTSYEFLVPDVTGNIAVQQTPPPHITYVTGLADNSAPLVDVTGTIKMQGDRWLAPAKIERGADRVVLTFIVPYGRPIPNIAVALDNGVLGNPQSPTTVQHLNDRTVVTAVVFDLDHPIVLYVGTCGSTCSGQHRLVLTL